MAGAEPPTLINNTIVRNQAPTGAGVAIDPAARQSSTASIAGAGGQPRLVCGRGAGPGLLLQRRLQRQRPRPTPAAPTAPGCNGNISADPLLQRPTGRPSTPASARRPSTPATRRRALPAIDLAGATAASSTGTATGGRRWTSGPSRRRRSVAGGRLPPASTPARILDTRTGAGAPPARSARARRSTLQVTGRGGVPADGRHGRRPQRHGHRARRPTSYLTAWPTGHAPAAGRPT